MYSMVFGGLALRRRPVAASGSSAAWVTHSALYSGTGTSHTVPLGATATAGNALMVTITMPTGTSVTSVNDSGGNAMTLAKSAINQGGVYDQYIYVRPNLASGITGAVVTIGASASIGASAHEATGIDNASPVDGTGGSAEPGFSGPHTVTFTTTTNSGLALSRWVFGATMTGTAGWTADALTAGEHYVYTNDSTTLGTAGAKSLTLTNGGGSTRVVLAAFKAA